MKSTTVIIVTHNSQVHIGKAMECLRKQTLAPERIIIVDSGSQDISYLEPYACEKDVEVVIEKGDIGFCRGNNVGMARVRPNCRYVFFLNPDAFLTPDFIESAAAYMQETPRCGMLTGTVLGYDIAKDRPTGKYDSSGVFRKWYGKWYDRDQGQYYETGRYLMNETVPAICGAVMFCRKKALDSVMIRGTEVLDNAFYMYKEDIDLSLRLRKRGWQLAFIPSLIVYHCRGWNRDRSQMPRKMRMHSAKNEMRIQLRSRYPLGVLYALVKYTAVKVFDR